MRGPPLPTISYIDLHWHKDAVSFPLVVWHQVATAIWVDGKPRLKINGVERQLQPVDLVLPSASGLKVFVTLNEIAKKWGGPGSEGRYQIHATALHHVRGRSHRLYVCLVLRKTAKS